MSMNCSCCLRFSSTSSIRLLTVCRCNSSTCFILEISVQAPTKPSPEVSTLETSWNARSSKRTQLPCVKRNSLCSTGEPLTAAWTAELAFSRSSGRIDSRQRERGISRG